MLYIKVRKILSAKFSRLVEFLKKCDSTVVKRERGVNIFSASIEEEVRLDEDFHLQLHFTLY